MVSIASDLTAATSELNGKLGAQNLSSSLHKAEPIKRLLQYQVPIGLITADIYIMLDTTLSTSQFLDYLIVTTAMGDRYYYLSFFKFYFIFLVLLL